MLSLLTNSTFIQAIGFMALLFVIFSFQKNKRETLLVIMLIGLLLFVAHYSLLGAWTGALMNFIEAGVVFVAYKKETVSWAKKSFWLYFLIAIFIIAGLSTMKANIDYLPIVAQVFGTIAVWQKNPRVIRYVMLVPRPLWFIYNFIVGSYAGMVTEVFIFLSIVVGIIRFDIFGTKRDKPTKFSKSRKINILNVKK